MYIYTHIHVHVYTHICIQGSVVLKRTGFGIRQGCAPLIYKVGIIPASKSCYKVQ